MAKQIVNKKDPGKLIFSGEQFAGYEFKNCVLSMTGAPSRSRLDACKIENILLEGCTVGHAIFRGCQFRNIEATDTLTLYDALFIECAFAGYLSNFSFGHIQAASPFFSPERFSNDSELMEKASFCLDICSVTSMDECAFIGDTIARKIRFRRGQGLILKGERLDLALAPLLKSTNDLGLATVLASAVGFGSAFNMHFCAIPTEMEHKYAGYAAVIRDQGVEVIEEPLC